MNENERREQRIKVEREIADIERQMATFRLSLAWKRSQLQCLQDKDEYDWRRRTGHANGRKAGK